MKKVDRSTIITPRELATRCLRPRKISEYLMTAPMSAATQTQTNAPGPPI